MRSSDNVYTDQVRIFNIILIVMRFFTIGFIFFLDNLIYSAQSSELIFARFTYILYVLLYISGTGLVFIFLRWWGRTHNLTHFEHNPIFLFITFCLDFVGLLGGIILYGIFPLTPVIYILIFMYAVLLFSPRLLWNITVIGLTTYLLSVWGRLSLNPAQTLIFGDTTLTYMVHFLFTPIYVLSFIVMLYYLKQALLRQEKILSVQNKLKTEFISTSAHKFRTPLANLKWTGQMLAETEHLTDEQHTYVHRMQQSTQELLELNDLLLRITRLEQEDYVPSKESVHIEELVHESLQDLQTDIEDKEIHISESKPYETVRIYIDKKEIIFVLQSILKNAMQYSSNEGNIEIQWEEGNTYACISVKDQGIGIPAEDQAHIFEKFYRAHNTDLNAEGAFGLHLYIAREIVHAHDGYIEFTSAEGEGTTFTICLPTHNSEQGT